MVEHWYEYLPACWLMPEGRWYVIGSIALLMLLAFASCEKEATRYPEMAEYHAESVNLPSATTDSVSRFSQKFKAFVTNHPAAMGDPLYPEIQKNIKANLLRLSITIDDEWDGETTIEF